MNVNKLVRTHEIPGFIFVRVILGYVFLIAGLQKFIFYDSRGPGRFIDMGFPYPEFTAYFVGFFEVLCAILILAGLFTRLAAIPLIITMIVAISVTKLPLIPDGLWDFAHALRLDLSMLLLSFFVLFTGADRRSLDYLFFGKRKNE